MRIVASGAHQRPTALLETRRLTQPVSGADDLELIVMPGPFRVIEVQHEISQRLARPERKCAAFVALDGSRQHKAGGLQMALHADFELAVGSHARRVENGLPDLRRRSLPLRRFHVPASRTVAALAIDAFRKLRGIEWVRIRPVVSRIERWVAVVAKETVVADFAAKVEMIGAIVARTHGEHTRLPRMQSVRIPRHRQLHQAILGGAMEIGARMVARSHHVVDRSLEHIDFARRALLVASFKIAVTAANHLVVAIRCLVIDELHPSPKCSASALGVAPKNDRPMPVWRNVSQCDAWHPAHNLGST